MADYTAALRSLRGWSGLTYRQLEGKASADGAVLPSSTIATTLGRSTLPREQFVEAFVRACGLDDDNVRLWIAARKRLAGDPAVEQSQAKHIPAVISALAVIGVLALLGGAGTGLYFAFRTAPSSALEVAGLALPAVGSWAQIHPARTPAQCVTEGRDRSGRYPTEIAVQFPCAGRTLPRTYLEPVGDGMVQIQWHHPVHGIGCLTVIRDGDGRDLLEPRDACDDDQPTQRFLVEPVGPPEALGLRLHVADTDRCLGLRGEELGESVELVQGPCSEAAAQRFRIELTAPPS